MVLKYTGLHVGNLLEGTYVTVPTDWKTSEFGLVVEDAWSEISDSLYNRGIYTGSRRAFNHAFATTLDGKFLLHWEEL